MTKAHALLCAAVTLALLFVASRAGATNIRYPQFGQLVTTTELPLVLTDVYSDPPVVDIHVQIGSQTVSLTDLGAGDWSGKASLVGVPHGVVHFTWTFVAADGQITSADWAFIYHAPPTIAVTSPRRGEVARHAARVSATCEDENHVPCSSFSASYQIPGVPGPIEISSGVPSVDERVDFSAADGSGVSITFTGTVPYQDMNGWPQDNTLAVSVGLAIDASPALTEVAGVDGSLVDADCNRLLVQSVSSLGLSVYDRASGGSSDVTAGLPFTENTSFSPAVLTPYGAIFGFYDWSLSTPLNGSVLEWRGGQRAVIGHPNGSLAFATTGSYAAWCEDPNVLLRDLATGTNTVVSSSAINSSASVASNGDVAFSDISNYQAYRWRSGLLTPLSRGPDWHLAPITDGINTVFAGQSPVVGSSHRSLTLVGPAGEDVLDPPNDRPQAVPGPDYQVNNGWAAYTSSGVGGPGLQIFVRDPNGVRRGLPFFGAASTLDGLDGSGGVMVLAGRRRYFAPASGAFVDVSGSHGRTKLIGGVWHLLLGRSLFRIDTGADGGAPVVGTCAPWVVADAGSDGATRMDGGSDAGGACDDCDGGAVDATLPSDATVLDDATTGALDAASDATISDAGTDGTLAVDATPTTPPPSGSGGCSFTTAARGAGTARGALFLAFALTVLLGARRTARRPLARTRLAVDPRRPFGRARPRLLPSRAAAPSYQISQLRLSMDVLANCAFRFLRTRDRALPPRPPLARRRRVA